MSANLALPSLLIYFNLSAAFDIIDDNILLNRSQHTTGLSNTGLTWFTSYLSDRTEHVSINGSKSRARTATAGGSSGIGARSHSVHTGNVPH